MEGSYFEMDSGTVTDSRLSFRGELLIEARSQIDTCQGREEPHGVRSQSMVPELVTMMSAIMAKLEAIELWNAAILLPIAAGHQRS